MAHKPNEGNHVGVIDTPPENTKLPGAHPFGEHSDKANAAPCPSPDTGKTAMHVLSMEHSTARKAQGNKSTTPLRTVITVQGTEYDLQMATNDQIAHSAAIAAEYAMGYIPATKAKVQERLEHLNSRLFDLREQLSRSAAERRALDDAGDFCLDDHRLRRDIEHMRKLGSLDSLIQWHHTRQQENGMNPERVRQWLSNDQDLQKIMDICSHGVIADTDPQFVKTVRKAPLRDLQRRMLPVYYKAAASMHDTHKVLLFRVSDLTQSEKDQIHMANEYHWRPEPGKVAGRPLMDCTNSAEDAIPLNTETTKSRGIIRYQQVRLPTFREVLTQWNKQRVAAGLKWSDMWIFKADITGCFNQIHWTPEVSKLMGFMLDDDVLMLMLTCGFGVTVTPMAWSVVGDAMNRTINTISPQPVFTFVDDFFGSGTKPQTEESQRIVHTTIRGVLGYEGLSEKKNVFSQNAEILGIMVNYVTGTVRPKDKAIEKMFYLLFSVDPSAAQPLRYWQCLASVTNLYAQTMMGMTSFVAPIIHMTHRGHKSRKTKATANTRFVIEIWRVVIVRALLDPESCAIPIAVYLQEIPEWWPYIIISDASPWRLCAAIYDPYTGKLLAWGTYRLPYAQDIDARYQGQREYMGHLYATILLIAFRAANTDIMRPAYYQWVNDNSGALAWAHKHKCSSLAGQYTCFAVTQLHLLAKVTMAEPQHKPGIEMGDIDTMSRLPDGQHPTSAKSRLMCPTLTPEKWWNTDSIPQIEELYKLIDPSISYTKTSEFHTAYHTVYTAVQNLLCAIEQ